MAFDKKLAAPRCPSRIELRSAFGARCKPPILSPPIDRCRRGGRIQHDHARSRHADRDGRADNRRARAATMAMWSADTLTDTQGTTTLNGRDGRVISRATGNTVIMRDGVSGQVIGGGKTTRQKRRR
jgi:hypothetical protein